MKQKQFSIFLEEKKYWLTIRLRFVQENRACPRMVGGV